MSSKAGRKFGFIDKFEQGIIALILGLMTLLTFANVVVRYVFNASYFQTITETLGLATNILWALEVTLILFAWLVLLGSSYCVKITAHLGVDALVNIVSPGLKRSFALISVSCCIIYSFLLLKGGWDFWANFANLPQTTGRWFPTGFAEKYLSKGWFQSDDVVMPDVLQFLSDWFNNGERYEKIPRFLPYLVLPLGMGLLLFRYCQIGAQVVRGERDMIIVSHEAEDAVEEAAQKLKSDDADDAIDGSKV